MSMSGALISLVAYGKEDAHLNGSAVLSAYFTKDPPIRRSTFTYLTTKPSDGCFEFSQGSMDRLGDMYLVYEAHCEPFTCYIEHKNAEDESWTLMESLSPEAMEVFAAMNPRDYKPRGNATPLPFFFTGAPKTYLPITEKNSYRVCCSPMPRGAELLYKAVYLDTDERKLGLSGRYHHQVRFSYTTSTTVCGPTGDVCLKLDNPVSDMQVIVEDGSGNRIVVPEIELLLNGYSHTRLPSVMTTMVVPSKYYNIDSNPQRVHYLPFSHSPDGPYTCSINFSRIDYAKLLLHGLGNQSYKVTVLTRHHNTLLFDKGKCSLMYGWDAST